MLDKMPKWVAASDVREDASPQPPLLQKPPSDWLRKLQKICLMILAVAFWASLGTLGWFSHQLFSTPDFSEIKAEFDREGRQEDGERLSELGKICRNGSATPMACKALYFGNIPAPGSKDTGKEKPIE